MIRNSEVTYGSVAKWLHWLTALWILAAYVSIYTFEWVYHGEGPMRGILVRFHKGVGFSVLIFFALRLYWRMTNPNPKLPESMPNWQIKASHASHFLLYFFLLAMPLSGYLGNGSGVQYGIFDITPFKETGFGIWLLSTLNLTVEQWEFPIDYFHYQLVGPYILWVIIAVHASAALYHHYVEKDDILKRMLPDKPDSID
jgi:cytochrome b561